MIRIYILFSFALLLSSITVKGEFSSDKNRFRQGSDTLSNNVKNYITKLAILEGLDKSSIQIEVDP